ncbi:MAG: hypothetical protein GF411_14195 [Candidatus Lokiarchaeota archaeon]|nr:hypothetical protein [Candidatus Lokiarchaeota archaeon]
MRKVLTEQEDIEQAVAVATEPETPDMPDFDAIAKDMDYEIDEPEEKEDLICFNPSSLIRALEHAREDFEGEGGDTELHEFAEMLIELAEEKGDGECICVEDLEDMFEESSEEEAEELEAGEDMEEAEFDVLGNEEEAMESAQHDDNVITEKTDKIQSK